jgi:hypothetical protein
MVYFNDFAYFFHAAGLCGGIVNQCQVSDREASTMEPDASTNAALLAKAQGMASKGESNEIVGMQYGFVPLTAGRAVSLYGRGGADDLFSSDFR